MIGLHQRQFKQIYVYADSCISIASKLRTPSVFVSLLYHGAWHRVHRAEYGGKERREGDREGWRRCGVGMKERREKGEKSDVKILES